METIIKQLIEKYNNEVKEWNALVSDNESLEAKYTKDVQSLAEYKMIAKKQDEALHVLNESVDNLKSSNQKLTRQNIRSSGLIKALEHQVSVLRKEIKAWKEKAKRNQAANAENRKKLSRLQNKGKKKNYIEEQGVKFDLKTGYILNLSMVGMWTLCNKGNESLLISPVVQTLYNSDTDERAKCIPILYTNSNGTYITGRIRNDGECMEWSSPLVFDENTPERTKKLARKFDPHPSEEMNEIAKKWAYKVNILQGAHLKAEDILKIDC